MPGKRFDTKGVRDIGFDIFFEAYTGESLNE